MIGPEQLAKGERAETSGDYLAEYETRRVYVDLTIAERQHFDHSGA